MYHIKDPDELCDLCGEHNDGNNLRNFQHLLETECKLRYVTLCVKCSLKAWTIMSYFHINN